MKIIQSLSNIKNALFKRSRSISTKYPLLGLVALLCSLLLFLRQLDIHYTHKAYLAIINSASQQEFEHALNKTSLNRYITLNNKTLSTLLIQAIVNRPDDPQADALIQLLVSKKNIDLNKPEMVLLNGAYVPGRKPINWAVERGNVAAVKLLAQRGADLHAIDPLTNLSPLSFAQHETDPELRTAWHLDEIESLLQEHLAK